MVSRDATQSSRKRAREENDGDTQVQSQKSKDLYNAMKVACSAKKYSEAVDICTEALNEEHLSKSSRTQFLLARSSNYSKMDDSFSMAIKDAKQAIILSPAHAMGYLRAAKAFHQEGHKTKATQALAKAASLTTDTMSDLSTYIRDLQQEWNVPHIQSLPYEILAEIFQYSSITDLVACTSTCRRWKSITMGNPSIWRKPIILRGSIKQIDARWKSFYKLTGGGHISSLTLDLTSDTKSTSQDLLKAWQSTTLRKTFPSNTLTHFDYSGRDASLDEQIWSCVSSCSKLKSLRWKSRKPDRQRLVQEEENCVHCQIRGTPLAGCRLEELYFDDPTTIIIDEAFVKILSQVKRLYLMMYLPTLRLKQILNAAKATVQELSFTGTLMNYTPYEGIESLDYEQEEAEENDNTPIEMKELTSIEALRNSARDQPDISGISTTRFVLPKVTRAVLKGNIVQWAHMQLWQESLIHLEYDTYVSHATTDFGQLLHPLPNCESLVLTFKEDVDMTRFWESIRSEDETQRILPKLKHLKIAGHPTLQGSDVVNLVRFRTALKNPIETLHIYQSEQVDYGSVAYLRRVVPDFIYSTSTVGRQFLQEL